MFVCLSLEGTKMSNETLLKTMIESLEEKIQSGLEIYGNLNQAIEYAKTRSTAGAKVWEIVLAKMGAVA